jgi:hypothetical protein
MTGEQMDVSDENDRMPVGIELDRMPVGICSELKGRR